MLGCGDERRREVDCRNGHRPHRNIIGTALVLAGLMSAQLASVSAQVTAVNDRIDDLIARMASEHAEIRTEIRRIDDRLRSVELAVKPKQPAD